MNQLKQVVNNSLIDAIGEEIQINNKNYQALQINVKKQLFFMVHSKLEAELVKHGVSFIMHNGNPCINLKPATSTITTPVITRRSLL